MKIQLCKVGVGGKKKISVAMPGFLNFHLSGLSLFPLI